MYQPRRYLSQIHTTNYMPFIREQTEKNVRAEANRGRRPYRLPLNPPLADDVETKVEQETKSCTSLLPVHPFLPLQCDVAARALRLFFAINCAL